MSKTATRLVTASAICASLFSAAFAGDANRASVLQLSPLDSTNGNVLVLDQSAASNSVLTGVPLVGTLIAGSQLYDAAATQIGEGNNAHITLTGDGAVARLLQSNGEAGSATPGIGNRAAILATSAAVASLIQVGLGNEASLTLDPHASALVSQIGNGNLISDLSVGTGGDAVVTQTGNHNTTGAIVVPPGVALNYTQTGNGLGPVNSSGVQILYSAAPGPITITQQGW